MAIIKDKKGRLHRAEVIKKPKYRKGDPVLVSAPKPRKAAAPVEKRYIIKALYAGKTYESHGYTVLEALTDLKIPGRVRGRVILVFTKGDLKKEWVMPLHAVLRMFSPSRIVREVSLKNASLLFDL